MVAIAWGGYRSTWADPTRCCCFSVANNPISSDHRSAAAYDASADANTSRPACASRQRPRRWFLSCRSAKYKSLSAAWSDGIGLLFSEPFSESGSAPRWRWSCRWPCAVPQDRAEGEGCKRVRDPTVSRCRSGVWGSASVSTESGEARERVERTTWTTRTHAPPAARHPRVPSWTSSTRGQRGDGSGCRAAVRVSAADRCRPSPGTGTRRCLLEPASQQGPGPWARKHRLALG